MNKKIYQSLLPLVNNKHAMELLVDYAIARIEVRRDQLEQTIHSARFKSTQGSIAELRRLLTLRDEVIEDALIVVLLTP